MIHSAKLRPILGAETETLHRVVLPCVSDDIISAAWVDTPYADFHEKVTALDAAAQHVMMFDISQLQAVAEEQEPYILSATLWVRLDPEGGGTAPVSAGVYALLTGVPTSRPCTWASTAGGFEAPAERSGTALNSIHPLADRIPGVAAEPLKFDLHGRGLYYGAGYKELGGILLASFVSNAIAAPQNPAHPHLLGVVGVYSRPAPSAIRVWGTSTAFNPHFNPFMVVNYSLANRDIPD